MLSSVLQILPLLVVVGVVLLLRWNQRRVPDWGAARRTVRLQPDASGGLVVPVSQLALRRTFSGSSNGLSPKLWVIDGGLRFKVFKLTERSFHDYERVEAHKSLFHGTRLVFVGSGERLQAMVRDRDVARAVLHHLPADMPLSPAAAALRGDA